MTRLDINSNEYDSYYEIYLNKVDAKLSLEEAFVLGMENTISFFSSIPNEKLLYRYEPGKWSIKEILQHLIDTERIFIYRCFRIARRDVSPLMGFDQNIYVEPSKADEKKIQDLIEEFRINRKNSISLLHSLTDEDLAFIGVSSGNAMSARAAAFVIPGHDIWHTQVIKERYL